MLILAHVIIALASIGYTFYLFISPVKALFYPAYGLVALTLISGTYLVITTHSSLLPACTTGVVYLGVVLGGLLAAHRKLANANSSN